MMSADKIRDIKASKVGFDNKRTTGPVCPPQVIEYSFLRA